MPRVAPLPRSLLDDARSLLGRVSADAAVVAEEKLFGPAPVPSSPLGAFDDGDRLVGVAVVSGRWLRLLAVDPDRRRQGAGSALLAAAEAAAGAPRLRVGDQPGNYFTPGIDERDAATLAFFERRGYRPVARYENLLVTLADHVLAPTPVAAGYVVRRATRADAAALAELAGAFTAAWAFEAALALANEPPTVHLACLGDRPVAFACIEANNRGLGWFGPAGTLPEHRGRRLGEALLLSCLRDAAAAGHREATIAWIGPRGFYERTCGARSGPTFVVVAKDLTP